MVSAVEGCRQLVRRKKMGKRSALRIGTILAVTLCSLSLSSQVWAVNNIADLDSLEQAFVELARKVSPSVVAIETECHQKPASESAAGGRKRIPMVGSGVVIDAAGLILTNDHVIRDGDKIFVTIDGGDRFQAQVVSRDQRSDLAVISIKAQDLVPGEFGDLGEVSVGQWALAMGNPFGTARDGRLGLSYGIVSALGKSLHALEENGKKYYGNLIQTTADINPGNSGGPLFNIKGQVIGINTAIETKSGVSEGLGFAVPISSRTKCIIETLARGEEVKYGFLGVNIMNLDPQSLKVVSEANRWGVQVTRVFEDSPAWMAKIQEDDLILEFDSTFIKNTDHLIRVVGATPVGVTVPIVVYRQNHQLVLDVTISEREQILVGSTK